MKKIIMILTVFISCNTKHGDTVQKDAHILKQPLKVAYFYDYIVPTKSCDCDLDRDWKKKYDAVMRAYEKSIELAGWPKKSIKHANGVGMVCDEMSTVMESTAVGYDTIENTTGCGMTPLGRNQAFYDSLDLGYFDGLTSDELFARPYKSYVQDTTTTLKIRPYPRKINTKITIGEITLPTSFHNALTNVRVMKESDSEIIIWR